jgi:hypothetical protein
VNNFATPEDTSAATSAPITSDFGLGSNAYGGLAKLTGRIAEVAIWNGELTAKDLRELSAYLLARYGLTVPAP